MLKGQLATVLDKSGLLELALRARARLPSALTVLNYHSVRAEPSTAEFDPGVIDATPATLDAHLTLLARHYSLIGLEDVFAALDGRPLPRNPVLLTFDDGYRDNVDVVLPLLTRHGARAVFFVATSYITDRRLFWWDRIAWLVHKSPRRKLSLTYPYALEVSFDGDRQVALRTLLRVVKDVHGLDLERYMTELGAAADVTWDRDEEKRRCQQLLMTWDDVRALAAAGMDVQSHTRTHRVLHTVPPAELASELLGSRADLERELGAPVRAIAYPVGRSIADAPVVRAAVRAAGYKIGFAYGQGPRRLRWKQDPLDIHRLSPDRETSSAQLRLMLAMAPLAR